MNIILFGYRGCGKTTVGRLLAEQLGLKFVDVDVLTMERFDNDSIADIWDKFGEPAWRREEVAVTRDLCSRDGQIIALGGGTLMQAGAREAVETSKPALRVYLTADPEELHRRISGDADSAKTRPNLTNLGGGVEEIRAMLAKRGPVYEAVADVDVDVTTISPQGACEKIKKLAIEV